MKRKVGFIALILTLAIAVCGFVGCSLFDETDSLRISRYPRIVYHVGEDLTGETFMKVVLTKDGKATPLELTFKDASTLVGEADGATYEFDVANFDLTSESQSARRTATISYDTVYATFQYEVVGVKTFVIENATDLNNFRDNVNAGVAEYISPNTVVELKADIVLTGAWVPISNFYRSDKQYDKWFKGEFKGNGHKIVGLTNEGLNITNVANGTNASSVYNSVEINYGLFGCVYGANIHDIVFENVNIVGDDLPKVTNKDNVELQVVADGVGTVAGYSHGSSIFANITVNGTIDGYDNVGGIVGIARGADSDVVTVNNCVFNGTAAAYRRAAAVMGQIGGIGKAVFTDCVAKGTVDCGKYDADVLNKVAKEARESFEAQYPEWNKDAQLKEQHKLFQDQTKDGSYYKDAYALGYENSVSVTDGKLVVNNFDKSALTLKVNGLVK